MPINTVRFDHESGPPESLSGPFPEINKPLISGQLSVSARGSLPATPHATSFTEPRRQDASVREATASLRAARSRNLTPETYRVTATRMGFSIFSCRYCRAVLTSSRGKVWVIELCRSRRPAAFSSTSCSMPRLVKP